jgi:adenylosuccinate synthase
MSDERKTHVLPAVLVNQRTGKVVSSGVLVGVEVTQEEARDLESDARHRFEDRLREDSERRRN